MRERDASDMYHYFKGELGRAEEEAVRLKRDLAEARRVARSVATGWMTYLATGKLPEPAADVDTALAYPEQDSTKET